MMNEKEKIYTLYDARINDAPRLSPYLKTNHFLFPIFAPIYILFHAHRTLMDEKQNTKIVSDICLRTTRINFQLNVENVALNLHHNTKYSALLVSSSGLKKLFFCKIYITRVNSFKSLRFSRPMVRAEVTDV
jgi:hypothetical protein